MSNANNNAPTIGPDWAETARAMGQLTEAIRGLAARMDKAEAAQHTPPCRHVDALAARLAAVEKISNRAGDLAWKIIGAVSTAAAAALWAVLQMQK